MNSCLCFKDLDREKLRQVIQKIRHEAICFTVVINNPKKVCFSLNHKILFVVPSELKQ